MGKSEIKTSQLDGVSGNSESGILSDYFVSKWMFSVLLMCVNILVNLNTLNVIHPIRRKKRYKSRKIKLCCKSSLTLCCQLYFVTCVRFSTTPWPSLDCWLSRNLSPCLLTGRSSSGATWDFLSEYYTGKKFRETGPQLVALGFLGNR